MQKEYKQIIRNFSLTKKEARTLKDAEMLIEQMQNDLKTTNTEYLEDLKNIIDKTYDKINLLNARLNVESTLGEYE